jgi:hypothetical protein
MYVFRFPSNMPKLTFDGLADVQRIGTTVEVLQFTEYRILKLYGLKLAYIFRSFVEFPETGDHHQATREWLQQIVRDNGIGDVVFRDHNGQLVIDGQWPLEGHIRMVNRRD